MARPKSFGTAYQDARGNWWADSTDADGNVTKVPVSGPQTSWAEGNTVYNQMSPDGNERAGFSQAYLPSDAWRWQSGAQLTPEEFQQFYSTLASPRVSNDFGNLTAQQYLNDPRSLIRQENGQYVYRPEMQQGDFNPIPQDHSFGSLAKGFLSSPGIALMGAGIGVGSGLNALGLTDAAGIAGAAPSTIAGGPPASYWNMLAEGAGTASDAAPAWAGTFGEAAGAADAAIPGAFSEFANPVLTDSLAGAAGTDLTSLATAPNVGSYGMLDSALPAAYGGSASIPGIQSILQGTGSAGVAGASPGFMQQLSDFLRSPLLPGSSNGQNDQNNSGLNYGQLLGGLLSTGLGYVSAKDQANAQQQAVDRALAITQAEQNARKPFSDQATSWLQNPSSFWGGDWAQEMARQTARAIGGARHENLFDNPTGQSLVMQSLAPMWLNGITQIANLGLQNTAPLAGVTGTLGLQAAQAQGMPSAVLGAGINDLFGAGSNNLRTQNDILRQLTMQGSGWSGVRFG